MEAKSIQKYIISSPQKLREVVYMIKKMKPTEAIEKLPFTHKRAAEPLAKVIKSAVANAKQKGAIESELVFKEIQINEGPRLKRFRAGSRGRAKPYRKEMSHIRVVVETLAKVETKAADESKIQKEEKEKELKMNEKEKKTVKKGVKKANS